MLTNSNNSAPRHRTTIHSLVTRLDDMDETIDPSNSLNPTSQKGGRKRQLEETVGEDTTQSDNINDLAVSVQDTNITMDNDAEESSSDGGPTQLYGLRLEAIFLPKFENETRSNQDIRVRMKERVALKSGHLEVTLKHSGSLLLWSGGQRFYSKNATDNQFTHVGEIILRQHFYRAWYSNNGESQQGLEQPYHDCSDYIQMHRLTLAFELVTNVLGHHGSIPHKDFLILTAVADKQAERFYSTCQLVALAHRFRLPHNDSWVFGTPASVEALFRLYDTTRETGLAQDTIQALTQSADSHVCSMYPHAIFQGNILEGIVIRYVAGRNEQQAEMNQLACASRQILAQVPPETPSSFDLAPASRKLPPVLTTNVRDIFEQCMIFSDGGKDLDQTKFEKEIGSILVESGGRDQRRTAKRWASGKDQLDLPTMVKEMVQHNNDEESRRISRMISTLYDIRGRAEYKIIRETEPQGRGRWLCIIHVFLDSTFQKFHRHRRKGDMALFRGCCLELITEDSDVTTKKDQAADRLLSHEEPIDNDDDTYILKMKFLPYMVRTFGCRNGLGVLRTGGPEAFDQYTTNLMTKWEISREGMLKWQPFFRAWGVYAHPRMEGQSRSKKNNEDNTLLPLNATFYLDHLERFSDLYYSGVIKEIPERKTSSRFRGLVVVISLERDKAERFADYLAMELGGVRRSDGIQNIRKEDLNTFIAPLGGGAVYSGTVEVGVSCVRKHFKDYVDSISVVLVDCDEESIAALRTTRKDAAELQGRSTSWRTSKCNVLEVSGVLQEVENQEEFGSHDDIKDILKQLKAKSSVPREPDKRPGILFYFPAIPGSGKSALCDSQTTKELEQLVKDLSSTANGDSKELRMVTILEGDKAKKKYWQKVKQSRDRNPSSIFVADKNAPPSGWISVGNTFSLTRGVTVPVLPDDASLSTTTITGARFKNGDFNANTVRYYPYSLHYLAVCMARVLNRPPGSHNGNLDSSTENACMIVATFFGLYKDITADQFVDCLKIGTEKTGAMSLAPIRVPFFAQKNPPPLPSDLEDALVKSLQIQVGWEKTGKNINDSEVDATETELRQLLQKHSTMLQQLIVDESESRKSFLTQIKLRIQELDSLQFPFGEPIPSSFVKLVSVDVKAADVHAILRTCARSNSALSSFMLLATEEEMDRVSTNGTLPGKGFVENTHVTLAYHSEMQQVVIHEVYDAVEGHPVEMKVDGFLWSDKIAALSVTLATETSDKHKLAVPAPQKAFSHITVWYIEGARAKDANALPNMVRDGEAERLDFEEPLTLNGVISFWASDKTSS